MKKTKIEPQFAVDDEEFEEEIKTEKKVKKKKKKNKGKPNAVVYVVSVLIMIGLIYHSWSIYSQVASYTFLPGKYIKYAMIALIAICAFFSIYAFLPVNNLNKIIQSVLCAALCMGIVFAQNMLESYVGRLERLFTDIPTEGDLNINVYVLKDSQISTVSDLENKKIAVQTQTDSEYQSYAISVINKELEGKEVELVEYPDIFSALDAFYAKEVDAFMLNQSYESIITSNADFVNFADETKVAYTCIQKITLSYDTSAVNDITSEPFVMLIGGNDSWDYYDVLHDTGRTDVNMLCVVNPKTKQILLVTIPRDSYINLWGDESCPDKLTHSTWYGIDVWEEAIEDKLNVEINYYIRVGFSSIINIVDSLGGIDIYNPYGFYNDVVTVNGVYQPKYWMEEGELHLNGENALAYVRCRHGLENGDMSRNEHQAIVIRAIIDEVISVDGISHIADLLDAVNGTFKTDITNDQLYALAQMQLDDMASWTLTQCSITGEWGSESCYIMGLNGGNKYDVVHLDEQSIKIAQEYIQKVIDGETVIIQ